MSKKRTPDSGLKYLMEIGFERIRGEHGLADRFYKVFGKTRTEEIFDIWEGMEVGTKDFYDFKNSDPKISKALSEAYDGDIIRKACNYIDGHKEYFGPTILEVGCDCGMMSCFLAKTFPESRIVSIDRCEAAIENAKEFAKKQNVDNIAFLASDLRDINDTFDTVFSMRTVHENHDKDEKEDLVNDLGEQAEIYKESLTGYASALSNALSDHGKLISIERIDRNALLLGWMEAMNAVDLEFDVESYEELICEEAGEESSFTAFICEKGKECEIKAKDIFDLACSKYLDYTQAQYGGWDGKIVFENRRGKLIEGYKWEIPSQHGKGRISLWTHANDETGLISYQNTNGNVLTQFLDISQKEGMLKQLHEVLEECRAENKDAIITKMDYESN